MRVCGEKKPTDKASVGSEMTLQIGREIIRSALPSRAIASYRSATRFAASQQAENQALALAALTAGRTIDSLAASKLALAILAKASAVLMFCFRVS